MGDDCNAGVSVGWGFDDEGRFCGGFAMLVSFAKVSSSEVSCSEFLGLLSSLIFCSKNLVRSATSAAKDDASTCN